MSIEKQIEIEIESTPFVIVHRPLLQNRNLSAKAKLMLIWLLDKPAAWDCTIAGMSVHFSEGIDALRSGIKELQDGGYLTIIQLRDEQGRYYDVKWQIRYNPIKENITTSGFSTPGFSTPGFSPTRKNHLSETQIKKETNKEDDPFSRFAPDPLFVCSPQKEEKIEKICEKYSISPSFREEMYETEESQLFDAIEAWKQFCEKSLKEGKTLDCPESALRAAISKKWKPNVSKKDMDEADALEKQNENTVRHDRIEIVRGWIEEELRPAGILDIYISGLAIFMKHQSGNTILELNCEKDLKIIRKLIDDIIIRRK